MSSRAWTEVATGTEARSVRRWVRRAILPRLWIHFVAGFLIVIAALVYGRWVKEDAPLGPRDCRPGMVSFDVNACLSRDEDIFDRLLP